jgi:hypothetical protein
MHCILRRAVALTSKKQIKAAENILPFKLKVKNPTEEIKLRLNSYFSYNDEQATNLIKAFPYILTRDMNYNPGIRCAQPIQITQKYHQQLPRVVPHSSTFTRYSNTQQY